MIGRVATRSPHIWGESAKRPSAARALIVASDPFHMGITTAEATAAWCGTPHFYLQREDESRHPMIKRQSSANF